MGIATTVRGGVAFPGMLAGRVSAVDDMVCSIPGKQVKVFGKAIHTLSKLSDDLYIEADSKTFALRTVSEGGRE